MQHQRELLAGTVVVGKMIDGFRSAIMSQINPNSRSASLRADPDSEFLRRQVRHKHRLAEGFLGFPVISPAPSIFHLLLEP